MSTADTPTVSTNSLELLELVAEMINASLDINKQLGGLSLGILHGLELVLGVGQVLLELGEHALVGCIAGLARVLERLELLGDPRVLLAQTCQLLCVFLLQMLEVLLCLALDKEPMDHLSYRQPERPQ